MTYPRNYLFYEEWTLEAAKLYIDMDNELFQLLEVLPVTVGYLQRALPYYESHDAESLRHKLSTIAGLKGITSPMKELSTGIWVPDFNSRYFTEEFNYSLKLIWELTVKHGIHAPNIEKVQLWGRKMVQSHTK